MSIGEMPFGQEDFEWLQLMVGEFTCEVLNHHDDVQDYVSALNGARLTNQFIFNHHFLERYFESKHSKQTPEIVQGKGYLGFNSAMQCFENFWIDTVKGSMSFDRGVRKGNQLVMEKVITPDYKALPNTHTYIKTVTDLTNADEFSMGFFVKDNVDKETNLFTLGFKRFD
ncbi:MAG: DUF1579 family protein [Cellvibrionales bacterium]|nr:DUF1579 family protein [Cellvibrionales bacterium]